MTARWVGIDPGLDGAIVGLDADARVVVAELMPTMLTGVGGKRTLDVVALAELLAGLRRASEGRVVVVLERVGTAPGVRMGAASAISIGLNQGRIEGVLVALTVRHEVVYSQRWQRTLGLGAKGDRKAQSIALSQRLLPDLRLTPGKRTKPHDGLADAGCLALYAMRVHGGPR